MLSCLEMSGNSVMEQLTTFHLIKHFLDQMALGTCVAFGLSNKPTRTISILMNVCKLMLKHLVDDKYSK